MAAGLVALGLCEPAEALDSLRAMSQYLRTRWTAANGFPGGAIHAISQTGDGYLWIGAEKGLVRFDGVAFSLVPQPAKAFPAATVLGLAVDRAGDLWLRLRGPRALRYRGGEFVNVMAAQHLQDYIVTAMAPGRDGSLLLAGQGSALFAYRGDRLHPIAPASAMPPSLVMALAEASDGQIWVGTRDAGLFRMRGQELTPLTRGLPDLKINCLLPGADQEMWIGTDNGIARWNGKELTRSGVPAALVGVPVFAIIRDRDSNIWVGTARGLQRLDGKGAAISEAARGEGEVVSALFEDREGTLWSGGPNGIERIRESAFATYSRAEGLPSSSMGPVHAAANRVWFAPLPGGVYWLDQGRVGRLALAGLDTDVAYSITGGPGELWLGRRRGGLTHLREVGARFVAETFLERDGLAQNSVYAVHLARDGTVWAGTLSRGVSRLRKGRFTTFTTADGLASNTVTAILEGSDGRMWFATPSGVSSFAGERWTRYRASEGLPSEAVDSLLEDRSGVLWAGTTAGLAAFIGDRFVVPARLPPSLQDEVLGMAEDGQGFLWVATASAVLRAHREKLGHGSLREEDVREYGLPDGLLGKEGVKRHRSVVAAPDGRIWFSTNRGLSVVNPAREADYSAPAMTQVQGITADDVALDLRGPVRIAAGSQRVAFHFAGLILAANERVRYKYRLDGFDRTWSPPAPARDAVYTNLGPGAYTFRVMASNGDGSWDGKEASVALSIAPQLWQTGAFRLATGLACGVLAWALIRLRTRQLARRLSSRFEERLAERTRIAQDLHDTLLQGLVSAAMQLHVAAEQLPPDLPARASIGRVQQLMETVVGEGRNAVRGLRSSARPLDDLEKALARVPQELGVTQGSALRVVVEGPPRQLQPVMRDEVYRIGREALVNAFRHSGAPKVELHLEYGAEALRLRVRDDGCGIDPKVLEAGREGHFGLSGMRERASSIGAALRLRSGPAEGTQVDLSVPARLAYSSRAQGSPRGWFRRRRVGLPPSR